MRIRAVVCRGVWMTALVGSLVAGCGGEAGDGLEDSEAADASGAEGAAEVLPTDDGQAEPERDSGQLAQVTQAVYAGCVSKSVSWTQWQPTWNGNTGTAGTYICYGELPSATHGYIVSAMLTNSDQRTGSAQYTCSNGNWVVRAGATCNGKVISTLLATGNTSVCSSADPVRSKWISWYLADLKRCADASGLDWWVTEYNNNSACFASNNYDGYGTKDGCWRAHFRAAANTHDNSYAIAQSLGHIAPSDEVARCGSLAYPWSNVSAFGASCKFRP